MTPHTALIDRLRVFPGPTREAAADAIEALEQQVAAQQAQMYADRRQALVWRDQVAALNEELQKRDKCSYIGPMRDCPTHGIGQELAAYKQIAVDAAAECNALRADRDSQQRVCIKAQAEAARLTLELDEAGSNCSMYKQQVLSLTKERDELVKAPATILELCAMLEKAGEALEETTALCTNYEAVEEPDGYQFTEAPAVIKQGNEALAAIKQWKEQT